MVAPFWQSTQHLIRAYNGRLLAVLSPTGPVSRHRIQFFEMGSKHEVYADQHCGDAMGYIVKTSVVGRI